MIFFLHKRGDKYRVYQLIQVQINISNWVNCNSVKLVIDDGFCLVCEVFFKPLIIELIDPHKDAV